MNFAKSPTFWLFLIILVFITFGPRMYEGLPFVPRVNEIAHILDPVAIATVLLAAATFLLVIDSSKNIEISKNKLLEERLVREMEELIKPIYMEKDKFEYYEWVHVPYYDETGDFQDWEREAHEFWDQLEANRYLTPKDLRDLIKDYSETNKEWNKRAKELANKIRESLSEEGKRELCEEAPTDRYLRITPGYFDYRFINLPEINEKSKRKEEIKKLADQLKPGSESLNLINEFVKLIDADTVLESKRAIFRAKVVDRYEKLEQKIDEIRESMK